MSNTEPQPLSEAQEVAQKERRPKKRFPSDSRPRFSLHVNWNPSEESEMLYYQAFRLMPHGLSKRVVIKFLDILVGDCTTADEVANIFYAWTRARDAAARMVMTGGAPPDWRKEPVARSTVEQVAEQPKERYDAFVQRQFQTPPPKGFRHALVRDEEAPQPGYRSDPVRDWLRERGMTKELAELEAEELAALAPAPKPQSEQVVTASRQQSLPGSMMNLRG